MRVLGCTPPRQGSTLIVGCSRRRCGSLAGRWFLAAATQFSHRLQRRPGWLPIAGQIAGAQRLTSRCPFAQSRKLHSSLSQLPGSQMARRGGRRLHHHDVRSQGERRRDPGASADRSFGGARDPPALARLQRGRAGCEIGPRLDLDHREDTPRRRAGMSDLADRAAPIRSRGCASRSAADASGSAARRSGRGAAP